ncbi:DUF3486 family protein [Comamonas aquatica]|uniref:DUF3486 family protein n=1 Tax=Comamonas aquatica TaxID=225991 RepID=UPI0009DE481C|nr:DUF3486 family protein [Comamonas aquatica]
MSRASSVLLLTPEQHALVDASIRRHRYVNLAGMLAELEKDGIKLSRSGLHRYVVGLKEQDAMFNGTNDDLVVVMMERSTGSITTLTTNLSRQAVIGLIGQGATHETALSPQKKSFKDSRPA